MMRRTWFAWIVVFVVALGCRTTPTGVQPYPETKKGPVVDTYHGTQVPDPYRWLEEDTSEETKRWTAAQNELTFGYLRRTGLQESLRKRLTQLWDYPKYSSPAKRGGRYFFSMNEGLQNQPVVYVQEDLDSEPRVLLDPNELSEEGTTALSAAYISKDGEKMAYALSVHGSDWQEFRIRKVDDGTDYEDVLHYCKFSGVAWVNDGSGFYYNRFPDPETVPEEDRNNFNRVYWHQVGTPQSSDILIFERPDAKELGFHPHVSEDGRFLILTVYHGTDPRNGLYYMPLDSAGNPSAPSFIRLLEPGEAMFNFIESEQDRFWVHTDLDAPRGRVVVIDTSNPVRSAWEEVVAEHAEQVVEHVTMGADRMVVVRMEHAHNVVQVCRPDGTNCRPLPLPAMGSVSDVSAHKGDPEMFYAYTSFLVPPQIYRYDFRTAGSTAYKTVPLPFDASQYETEQVFFQSRDGTRVPMFLTHRRGLEKTGDTPVLLYGYGGFNISLTPYFSVSRLLFLEAGGIYALVNLRGGAEYGEEWHQAGMLDRKQNVFDDFVGAAEYLVTNGYTKKERIATLGGSNGGLLVLATMLQRPDLFGAVVAAVPVADMLRYHKFTVGRYWVPEYGNPEDPTHFPFLYKYSPLHNIKQGAVYPPLLVTTADTDDRVVPGHSRKFVATIQAMAKRENPALIRIETQAGHGAGKPTTKRINEAADMFAFIFHNLGMTLPQ